MDVNISSYLLPDRSAESKRKTTVVRRSCNPHWNQTVVYENISWEELQERSLELTIWDHDRLTSNDFLGGVRLNLAQGASYLDHLLRIFSLFNAKHKH